MKIRFIFLILLTINQPATAESNLIGEWISDRELSIEYARKHIKMQEKTYQFLEEMLGRMRITFTPSQVKLDLPDWESISLGKHYNMTGFNETYSYQILATTPTKVVILTNAAATTEEALVVIYTFEGDDIMWTYVESFASPIREYFRRAHPEQLSH